MLAPTKAAAVTPCSALVPYLGSCGINSCLADVCRSTDKHQHWLLCPQGGGVQSIVMSMFVCLCVCLSVHSHNSKTVQLNFTKFFMDVACGCGSDLLWWHCDKLRTSGFTDDIVFSYCWTNGWTASDKVRLKGRLTSSTLLNPPVPSLTSDNYSVW